MTLGKLPGYAVRASEAGTGKKQAQLLDMMLSERPTEYKAEDMMLSERPTEYKAEDLLTVGWVGGAVRN